MKDFRPRLSATVFDNILAGAELWPPRAQESFVSNS